MATVRRFLGSTRIGWMAMTFMKTLSTPARELVPHLGPHERQGDLRAVGVAEGALEVSAS
jgi:hypothetical protein